MLYVTTRNKNETYTSHKALTTEAAADGGRYVPFKMPFYDLNQIQKLQEQSFNQIVVNILNIFFSSRLTVWDVDLCIGKNPMRLLSINHRMLVAELWHNPNEEYNYIVERIYERILGNEIISEAPDWVRTAVRIAVLFGIYGQLCTQGMISCGDIIDVSVSGYAFESPMAAFYARRMGLPINVILCTFDDDSAAWDLIHRGTFNTAAASDVLKCGVEKLLCATLEECAVSEYVQCCEKKRTFTVPEENAKLLASDFFCAVAGKNRAEAVVNSVYRSNAYVIDPVTALSYGGVQDYRSVTGKSVTTLIIAEQSPVRFIDEIAKTTGIPARKLSEQIKR